MTTRREFLSSMAVAGLASQPVFRESAMRSLFNANAIAGDRSPYAVADDETYWAEIQRAFDSDRTMINLNNGGCSPTPSHVLEAMIRDLRFSNELPVEHMWRVLEPRIESVRRDLASEFGCDPEEMAITRNASEANEIMIFGLDLKPGDEVVITQSELRPDDHVVGAARAPRRDRPEAGLVQGAAAVGQVHRRPVRGRDHAADEGDRGHPHHESHRTDHAGAARSWIWRARSASRCSSMERTPSRISRSSATISGATTTARASTSGCSRRSERDSSTCGRTSRRTCGR